MSGASYSSYQQKKSGKGRGRVMAIVVALVLIAGAGAYLWFARPFDSEPSDVTSPEPVQTVTEVQTVESTQTVTVSSTPEQTSEITEVDASDYLTDGGIGRAHYFMIDDGDHYCAIGDDHFGCQSTVVMDSDIDCGDDPDTRATAVSWRKDTGITSYCVNQPFYFAGSSDSDGTPGNLELPEDSRIVTDVASCEYADGALECTTDDGNASFTIKGDRIIT